MCIRDSLKAAVAWQNEVQEQQVESAAKRLSHPIIAIRRLQGLVARELQRIDHSLPDGRIVFHYQNSFLVHSNVRQGQPVANVIGSLAFLTHPTAHAWNSPQQAACLS